MYSRVNILKWGWKYDSGANLLKGGGEGGERGAGNFPI